MKTKYTVALSVCAGVAIGALAMQGLHAQGKPKAWTISEIEPVSGATVSPGYLKAARELIDKAHGKPYRTVNGRVVSIEGGKAPEKVAVVEWNSLDEAVAFYKSEEWKKLGPERDKAQKTLRRYVVEAEQ